MAEDPETPEELSPVFEMELEELLRRVLEMLRPLNHDEIRAKMATGHNVAILDADDLRTAVHYLNSFLKELLGGEIC